MPKRRPAPTPAPAPPPTIAPTGTVILNEPFAYPDGVVTNQYSHDNAPWAVNGMVNGVKIYTNPVWDVYGGELKALTGRGRISSPLFRGAVKGHDFLNGVVTMDALVVGMNPGDYWDGSHIWGRAQPLIDGVGCVQCYYATWSRRDLVPTIKKKQPGGMILPDGTVVPSDEGGGHYWSLFPEVKGALPIPLGRLRRISFSMKNVTASSVYLELRDDGVVVAAALDDGSIGGPAIMKPGHTGIRSDNMILEVDNFLIEAL